MFLTKESLAAQLLPTEKALVPPMVWRNSLTHFLQMHPILKMRFVSSEGKKKTNSKVANQARMVFFLLPHAMKKKKKGAGGKKTKTKKQVESQSGMTFIVP